MPVTAKLSRQFYERMGDDIANALVEWLNAVSDTSLAQLREFNELNFARFEAKLGERLGEVKTEMAERFAAADAKLDQRIGEVKAGTMELRAEMDARFAAADAKLDAILGERVGGVKAEVTELRSEMAGLRAELRSEIATARADLIKWMFVFVATATLAILGLG
jgi:hypothetical protein